MWNSVLQAKNLISKDILSIDVLSEHATEYWFKLLLLLENKVFSSAVFSYWSTMTSKPANSWN